MKDRTSSGLAEVTRVQFNRLYSDIYPNDTADVVDAMWQRFITQAYSFDMVAVLEPKEKAPASDPAWGEESL